MRTERVTVPLPTDEEMNTALEMQQEIVGVAAKNRGRFLFLKFASHTGGTAVVFFEPYEADYLFRALRECLPNRGENDGSPMNWAAEDVKSQYGHMIVEID